MKLMKAALVCSVLLSTGVAYAADIDRPPPGFAKYVMVLRPSGVETPGAAHPNPPNKTQVPDVTKLGGTVLSAHNDTFVIFLPLGKAKHLRKDENVAFLQRVWTGESFDNWDEGNDSGSALTEAPQTSDDEGPSWDSGAYLYDGSGNIKGIGTNAYTYDAAHRLTRAVVNGVDESYSYDSFGNLKEMAVAGQPPRAVALDSSSNRVSSQEYDVAGNMITNGNQALYHYDSGSQIDVMRSIKTSETRRMIYTADDERIGFQKAADSIYWSIRGFDGKVLRVFYSDSYNTWVWERDYYYAGGTLVAANREAYFGGRRHFSLDHLGSVRLVTNDARVRYGRHDYMPFGLEQTPSRQEYVNFAYSPIESMKFTGHERDYIGYPTDENTDYIDYMHARYYNPTWGRFLSVDPGRDWDLRRPQSWNMYAYVQNNPINRTDPTGKYTCKGTKDDCKQIADALTEARKSVANLPKNSEERARVQSIVSLYGKPGQRNGVVVDTSGKGRIPNAAGGASMQGKTLTFSVSIAAVKDQVSAFPNANLKSELAGVLMHDGQHLFDFKKAGRMFGNKAEELAGERRAGFTEAFMWQGLGQNASSEIYTNATGVNPEAIEFYAQRATAMWCDNGGPCQ